MKNSPNNLKHCGCHLHHFFEDLKLLHFYNTVFRNLLTPQSISFTVHRCLVLWKEM